jgi:alkylated DNA repair protein (DNA oxidative demethylase)
MHRDLFDTSAMETLDDGLTLLRVLTSAAQLFETIEQVTAGAPLRRMRTPGGQMMSVAMTNCGRRGWVSDRHGYRYSTTDPDSGLAWPVMPSTLSRLASDAAAHAGFDGFLPDVCLVNRYEPGARLSLHQDRDERDFSQPIVSVSLGLDAVFLVGGLTRKGGTRKIQLLDGDVIVFGGASRLIYHGIKPVEDGAHPVLGACRVNLTFRKAG